MLKFKDAAEAVGLLKAAVDEWQGQDTPIVQWQGRIAKALSAQVYVAAGKLFDTIYNDTPDEDDPHCVNLVMAIDAFDDAFFKWMNDYQEHSDRHNPGGSSKVWEAYNTMVKATERTKFRKAEPIQAMLSQNIPPNKIAQMYGWYVNGQPDMERVQEEISAPGTHYKPNEWQGPAEKRWLAGLVEAWALRGNRQRKEHTGPAAASTPPKKKKEAPESIEELIRQGVNIGQICKMKNVSFDHVRELAADMGVPLDVGSADPFYKQTKEQADEAELDRRAEELRLGKLNTYGELKADKKARVIAMHTDNVPPKDIVAALKHAFPDLRYQKVSHIIAEHKAANASKEVLAAN